MNHSTKQHEHTKTNGCYARKYSDRLAQIGFYVAKAESPRFILISNHRLCNAFPKKNEYAAQQRNYYTVEEIIHAIRLQHSLTTVTPPLKRSWGQAGCGKGHAHQPMQDVCKRYEGSRLYIHQTRRRAYFVTPPV